MTEKTEKKAEAAPEPTEAEAPVDTGERKDASGRVLNPWEVDPPVPEDAPAADS